MAEEIRDENVVTPVKKKNSALPIILIVVVVVLALIGMLLPKLIGIAFKGFLSTKGIDVDEKGGKVTLKTDEGEVKFDGDDNSGKITTDQGEFQYGENLALPADFPKNVPIYAGANIKSISSNTKEMSAFVTYTVSQEPTTLYTFYKSELESKGWKEQSTLSNQMVSFTNDTQTVIVFVSKNDGETFTTVSITLAAK